MSTLKLPLLYVGTKGERTINTLFDCSANMSYISPVYLENLTEAQPLGRKRKITIACGTQFIEVKEVVCLDFYINDILLSDEFFIVSEPDPSVVIGAATIRKWRIKLNFEADQVEVDPKVAIMQIK